MNAARIHQHPDDLMALAPFLRINDPIAGSPPSREQRHRRALAVLRDSQAAGTLTALAQALVRFSGIVRFLPERYGRFQPMVHEGLVFLLAGLPLERLAEKIVDQLILPLDALPAQRLLALVRDMPTLQKLGQVIGRTPGLPQDFRDALTELENNVRTLDYVQLQDGLDSERTAMLPQYTITPENRILAEATVCAVVPATVADHPNDRRWRAVLKMVKPAIRRHLPAELALWSRLGDHLDGQRERWGLGEFQLKKTIDQTRHLLENETDLPAEQANLDAARTYYAGNDAVALPERLPVSTPEMTAMSRLDGRKITEVGHLSQQQRRRLAATLARVCILRPVQDLRPEAIFHGDPHAGNIAYTFEGERPRIILYDWAMTGRLERLERFGLLLLGTGLLTRNHTIAMLAVDLLSAGQATARDGTAEAVRALLDEALCRRGPAFAGILSAIEHLFDRMSRLGIVFSPDLLMFQKAMVTLKGVLADIDPSFNRDDHLISAAVVGFINDFARFRLQKLLVREIWQLYPFNLGRAMEVQRILIKFCLHLGAAWLEPPRPCCL
jgi:ubiquinone biosynthesis protein